MEHARQLLMLAIILMVAAYVLVFVFRALFSSRFNIFKARIDIASESSFIDAAMKKQPGNNNLPATDDAPSIKHPVSTRGEKFRADTLKHIEQSESIFPEIRQHPDKKKPTGEK